LVSVSWPYPNPARSPGKVKVALESSCPVGVRWKIVTAGYRMVVDGTERIEGRTTVEWDLRDSKGKRVSNGLYYWIVESEGMDRRILKVMVLR